MANQEISVEFVLQQLDTVLPDEYVIGTLRSMLLEWSRDGPIDIYFTEEASVVPIDVKIQMVSKTLFKYGDGSGLGKFKAMVIFGEATLVDGKLIAEYGFATLYFSEKANLITHDFHAEFW